MNRRKTINFGDKIFARVSQNGKTVFNYVTEKVANMAQLLSELRFAMKDLRGLVMIHIRNYHQGWGEERPLMLYAPKRSLLQYAGSSQTITEQPLNNERKMMFPWETH
ncbi:MAG: hypothetical protein J1F12_02505 [Muribaculaceae bacterium]|nr:hypothetical protein [Muribaculaceae bacterium]